RYFRFSANEGGAVPVGAAYEVLIKATGAGLFTLRFDRVDADGAAVSKAVYNEIPISSRSVGRLSVYPDGSASDIRLDVDGDGTVDVTSGSGRTPDVAVCPEAL